MTEEKAGRELDAMVAEKVMGIGGSMWDKSWCPICGWRMGKEKFDCRPGDCSLRPAPQRRADEPAPYSTSIEAAWQVVEKMRERGWHFLLMHSAAGVAVATFFRGHEDVPSARGGGYSNAPEAICRAALAATVADEARTTVVAG